MSAGELDDRVAQLILAEAKEKERRYKERDGVGAYTLTPECVRILFTNEQGS